ncbi:hypothetical protein AMJ49_04040 [Parcubacteria bacterium DG_74_2]|nr:MAG: hypothetical protein AMJ49_04040 [Parcubacteria bacterium DG_74_2]
MTSKIKIFFLILIFGSFIFSPLTSLADGQYTVEVDGSSETVEYKGIVPCGKPVDLVGIDCCILPCTLCHFFVMFDNIIDFFMFNLVPVIAVLMLVFGGFIFLISGESPRNVEWGRSIITSTIKGLVIIFAAWLIVNTFFVLIKVSDWTDLKSGWFQVECGITTEVCDPEGALAGKCTDTVSDGKTPCSIRHANGDQVSPDECQ